jgi:hypothetical protein
MARLTPDEFRARLARLGGVSGAEVLDGTIETTDRFGEKTKAPNPNLKVRYTVGDKGGYVIARQHDDGSFEVIEEKSPSNSSENKAQVVQLGNGRVGTVTTDDKGNATYKPIDTGEGPKITRPGPVQTVDQGDGTAITSAPPETVSKDQADYDRQAALDRQARAEAAAKQAYDNAMLAIAKDKLTAEQARDQYQKDLDKIRIDLQKEQHADTMAATKRSQDITLRGQDLDAGVSQRNADLNASTQLAGEGSRIATALLPYWNAPGQIESTNSLMAGGPPVPTQPVSKPPVSPTLPLELAAAAQAQMPSRFTMPGVPPAQPSPYAMPTR